MADWAKPVIASNYITFVDEVKNRDIDAITLQLNVLTSPPTGAIKLVRAPIKFQEWNGTAFVDKILSLEGGGTGANTSAGARTNLLLGTMAIQNSNSVSITGGGIQNVSMFGGNTMAGGYFNFSSVNATPVSISSAAGFWTLICTGSATGVSNGVIVRAGTGNAAEWVFTVQNASASITSFIIRGDMSCVFSQTLAIPVGVDKWVVA